MWTLGLLALLASPATAADTVLHAGDADAAVAKVVEDASRAPEELAATTLPDLLAGRPPLLIGGGALETCQGEPATAETFWEALSVAESSMAFMEYGQALGELEDAAQVLGCQTTPADTTSASRLHYLRGLSFFFAEESEAARAAWVQAHRFHPGLKWDDNFPPDGQMVFEAARALVDADEPTTLVIVPTPSEGALWLDGRRMQLEAGALSIPGGKHLAQFGAERVTTVQLQLAPGSSNTRSVLSAALESALGTGEQVYAVHDGITWTGTAGGTSWEALEILPVPVPTPPEEVPPEARRKKTRWLFASGTTVAVVGGLAAMAMYFTALGEHGDAVDAWTVADYKQRETKFLTARSRYRVFSWVAVGGVGVAVAGIAIPVGGYRSAAPRARLGNATPPVDPFLREPSIEWVVGTDLIEP
ncbi:MAG: hypothetical protein JRI25_07150 [Deltaproteobacteria bacterium]|nr:hypothetical protein [Deltaproteobacteria bacterium]